MFRRLFFCSCVLTPWLLCWTGEVRAQHEPQIIPFWTAETMVAIQPQTPSQANLAAHRMYFNNLAANLGVSGEVTPALGAYLNDARLSKAEHEKFAAALFIYKKRFAALVAAYNNSPATLAGRNDDTSVFLIQRDLIVQGLIDTLKVSLSDVTGIEDRVVFWGHRNNVLDQTGSSPEADRHPMPLQGHLMPVQGNMSSHYTGYHTESVSFDANGNGTAYETGGLEGYTSCSGSCPAVYHTGKVYNGLGGGGWIWGPSVTPPTYMNVQNPQSFWDPVSCWQGLPGSGGCPLENYSIVSIVNCSSGFSWPIDDIKFTMQPALTFDKATSGGPGKGVYQLVEWCQPQYVPPNYAPGLDMQNQNFTPTFFWDTTFCFNSTLNPSNWFCPGGLAQGVTGSWDLQYCTKTKPPY